MRSRPRCPPVCVFDEENSASKESSTSNEVHNSRHHDERVPLQLSMMLRLDLLCRNHRQNFEDVELVTKCLRHEVRRNDKVSDALPYCATRVRHDPVVGREENIFHDPHDTRHVVVVCHYRCVVDHFCLLASVRQHYFHSLIKQDCNIDFCICADAEVT